MGKLFEGRLDGRGQHVGIVVARFNEFVTRALRDGARAGLLHAGLTDDDIVETWVPGSFELPLASRWLLDAGCDGVIALGAVIRGETAHFDYVCRGAADGLLRVGLDSGKPVVFGVLTVDTVEQAQARAGEGPDNKGFDAALTVVEMLGLRTMIRDSQTTTPGGRHT